MSPDPVAADALAAADDVNAEKEVARNRPLTRPRPGHADLVGMQKYGFEDARPGARARLGPRDRRAGGARRGRVGASSSRPTASGWCRTPWRSAPPGWPTTPSCPLPDDVDAARRRPGAHAGRRRLRRDGRRGRGGQEGRRHPGRGRRGRRLRPAAGPGLARALGPPARRPARRGADGDPGDQGRRGRRRVPHRGPPRVGGARRDGARRGRRDPAAHRPGRRHRGRHVHRRRAAGARRDEADLHRAARRSTPSTSPPASRPRRSTSAPTCAPCRPPASSPRRWSPWSWPQACVEKFGGDSVAETARNHAATSTRSPRRCASW